MIKNIIKKFKIRFFWITLERFPNLFRPSSKPYLSGDTLRNFSDHVFDESKSIKPNSIKKKDVVFVSSDVIDIFFNTVYEDIKNEFVLITHNSDTNINKHHLEKIDSRVIHWFAQNLSQQSSEKVSFIPIGLENLRRLKHGRRKWFANPTNSKTKNILSSFNEFTNFKERGEINSFFEQNKLVDNKTYDQVENYFTDLRKYKFVVCPEGNGYDTHRIWEGILLNTFPIFKISNFTKMLENEGIPGIYINKWSDLNKFTKEDLNEIYQNLLKKNKKDLVFFNFWEDRINNIRNSF